MAETVHRFKPNYRILVFLFVSHFFSRWGDRMWSFGVPLFLVVIYCNSLILAALYGLMLTIALTVFGTWVGDFVDATPRWKFVIITLFMNNLFIFLNAICLLLIILFSGLSVSYWEPMLYTLSVLLVIFGAVARLTSLGTNISVEKDWVVVIAHKDKSSLAYINTNLRRIDLICKLLAPVFITMIMHFVGLIAATIVLALWNVISFFVESLLITFVYNLEPNLATKEYRHKSESSDEESTKNESSGDVPLVNPSEEGILNGQEEIPEAPRIRKRKNTIQNTKRFAKRLKRKLLKLPKNFIVGWRIYFRQRVWLVGVSMACLYLTVLGFSGVTAGYFYTQGMTELFLGLAQGAAGIIGVGATFAFPYFRRLTGTVRTGVIGISLQLFSLSFCVMGVFAPGNPTFSTPPTSAACVSPFINSTLSLVNNTITSGLNVTTALPVYNPLQYTSLALMVTGVVTARFGLWLFDLSVVQIVQENVIESERGVVNGIMSSMNFFNDMLHFLLVSIFPLPRHFGYLTILSFIAIATAWVLFFTYVVLHEREVLYCNVKCCGHGKRGFEARPIEHDCDSSEEESIVINQD